MKSKCDNCDWTGTPTIGLEEIPDLNQRLDEGSVVPSGECPECGALCYGVNEPEPVQSGEHTPGPWALMKTPHEIDLRGNCGNTLIASFPTLDLVEGVAYQPGSEDAANLRLIATAPELLDMLREMVCRFEHNEAPEDLECLDRARAVIAKVKGQQ